MTRRRTCTPSVPTRRTRTRPGGGRIFVNGWRFFEAGSVSMQDITPGC